MTVTRGMSVLLYSNYIYVFYIFTIDYSHKGHRVIRTMNQCFRSDRHFSFPSHRVIAGRRHTLPVRVCVRRHPMARSALAICS